MTKTSEIQRVCARCHRRFSIPQRHRTGALCEDCQAIEDQPR